MKINSHTRSTLTAKKANNYVDSKMSWTEKQIDKMVRSDKKLPQKDMMAELKNFTQDLAQARESGFTLAEREKLKSSMSNFSQKYFPKRFSGSPESDSDQVQSLMRSIKAAYGEVIHNSPSRLLYDNERPYARSYYSFAPEASTGSSKSQQSGTFQLEELQYLNKVSDFIKDNLKAWDTDHSGALSYAEIREQAKSHDYTPEQSQILGSLLVNFSQIADISTPVYDEEDPLTVTYPGLDNPVRREIEAQELEALVPLQKNEKLSPESIEDAQNSLLYYSQEANKLASQSNTLFGAEAPLNPQEIEQGNLGDCWFIAAMATLPPEDIHNLIQENEDGSATVTLEDNTLVIDQPTIAEKMIFAQSKDGGYWPSALEMALEEVRPDDSYGTSNIIEGGWGAEGLYYLTGFEPVLLGLQEGEVYSAPYGEEMEGLNGKSLADIATFLEDSFSNNYRITAGTESLGSDAINLENGIASTHVYSVLGYDSKEQTVTVRNPWGGWDSRDFDGKEDGIITMGLREFQASFSILSAS